MKLPKVGDYFLLHNDSGPPLRIVTVFTRQREIMVKARDKRGRIMAMQLYRTLFWGSKEQCDKVRAARVEFHRLHLASYMTLHNNYNFVLDQMRKERNDG